MVLLSSAHSRQYVDGKLVKFLHLWRLYTIYCTIESLEKELVENSTLDLGSSDALLTAIIKEKFPHLNSFASDFKLYSNIHVDESYYKIIDLNSKYPGHEKYGLITCFETLEHVGNIDNGIGVITSLMRPNSLFYITVPIEIGFWGVIKFILKVPLKNYGFEELNCTKLHYFWSLLLGTSSSKRRKLPHYSYHFGFDHRDLVRIIENRKDLEVLIQKKNLTNFTIIGRLK